MPAYQRFHNLTSPVDHAIALLLPNTYKMLGQVFGAADTLLAMHYNRGEALTLAQLEKGGTRLTDKPCLGSYLRQVRRLFPRRSPLPGWPRSGWAVCPTVSMLVLVL